MKLLSFNICVKRDVDEFSAWSGWGFVPRPGLQGSRAGLARWERGPPEAAVGPSICPSSSLCHLPPPTALGTLGPFPPVEAQLEAESVVELWVLSGYPSFVDP